MLRKHLDEVPLWRGDNVPIKQLVDDFARYIYLPRLAGPEVLAEAMRAGVALLTWRADTFAYAESFDETAGRYRGLQVHGINIAPDSPGLIVKRPLRSCNWKSRQRLPQSRSNRRNLRYPPAGRRLTVPASPILNLLLPHSRVSRAFMAQCESTRRASDGMPVASPMR